MTKASGFKKARVAVARKLAVILHAMWKVKLGSLVHGVISSAVGAAGLVGFK